MDSSCGKTSIFNYGADELNNLMITSRSIFNEFPENEWKHPPGTLINDKRIFNYNLHQGGNQNPLPIY